MIYAGIKWSERMAFLSTVEDGWYEGTGEAIDPNVLKEAEAFLISLDALGLQTPALFPLLNDSDDEEFIDEGGILMEWTRIDDKKEDRYHISFQISNSFAYEVYVFSLTNREMNVLESKSRDEAKSFLEENLTRLGFVSGKGDMK
jgi:hypothetical protein